MHDTLIGEENLLVPVNCSSLHIWYLVLVVFIPCYLVPNMDGAI